MWLEIKIMFSITAMVFMGIVISQILLFNLMLGFLLFASIMLVAMGDMFIGYKIKHNHLDKIMDPPPTTKELAVLHTITGMIDFIWATKKPHGKREFMYHGEEASYINNGDYPIHMISGTHGCIIHESHDENINLFEAKAAEKIVEEYRTDDIKEVYVKTKKIEELIDENKI
jgi:hypothetical protein